MKYSEKLIEKFRDAHRRKFGRELSEREAERDLSMLATLVSIVVISSNKDLEGDQNE